MLTLKDIQNVFEALFGLGLNVRLGYAGSYARGKAKLNSDLDIVVEGKRALSDDEYLAIYVSASKDGVVHIAT